VKNNKAFTLIELVLAITILLGIIGAIVINYDSLVGNNRYFEARENLKTLLINLKHQAAYWWGKLRGYYKYCFRKK